MRFFFTLVTAVFLGNIAAAATVGDDGLHIQPWIRDTFTRLQMLQIAYDQSRSDVLRKYLL